jgi:hypothetical protein
VLPRCRILFLRIAERYVRPGIVIRGRVDKPVGNSMAWIHSATQQSFFETYGKTDDSLMPPVEGAVTASVSAVQEPKRAP